MPALPHRIRRQSFRVKARSQEEAFAIRKRLREDWEATLLPAVERAFNEAESEDGILHISTLHVDVRIAGVEDITERLPDLIYQEIRKQLDRASLGDELSAVPGGAASSEPSSSWSRMTPEEDRLQVLARYVETGSLPWPLTGAERSVTVAQLQEATAEELASILGRVLREPVDRELLAFYLFRSLQLVPQDQWGAVAALLAAGLTSANRAALMDVIAVLAGERAGPMTRYARLQVAATVMASSLTAAGRAGAGELAVTERQADAPRGRVTEELGARLRQWLAIHREHAAFYLRLFSLVPQEQWAAVVGVWAAGLPNATGAALMEVFARLTSDTAGLISSRDVRLELAAAAMAASRPAPDVARPGERASIADRAAGETQAGSSEERTARLPNVAGAMFRQWLDSNRNRAGFYFCLLSLVAENEWATVAAALPHASRAALAELIAMLGEEPSGSHGERTGPLPHAAGAMFRQWLDSHLERAGFYFRLLSLLPGDEWAVVARILAAGLPHESSAALAEVAALPGSRASGSGQAGVVTPYLQMALGAAAMAASHTGSHVASAADLASILEPIAGEAAVRAAEGRPLLVPMPEPIGERFAQKQPAGVRDMLKDTAFLRRAADPGRRGETPEAFPLAVSSAGLVLLHPFLPRFFESTGIKEAGRADLAPAALPRAAALLHLLATGEEEPYELDLGFIKILLGIRPESHLPVSAGLVLAADQEEADALLKAVVGHWSALKNTSVQGLRASFLQRRGFVREDEQGVRLQVESQPFDMLLNMLPWGIGTIKLPWMKKPIFTQWPTP